MGDYYNWRKTMKIRSGLINRSITRICKILVFVTLILFLGGCISKENAPVQNVSENISNQKNGNSNLTVSKENAIEIKINKGKDFNQTGIVNLYLNITNPRMNETAIMLFKTDAGVEGRYKSNVTNIINNVWTQEFSLKVPTNINSLQAFVEIYESNEMIKKTECNIQIYNLSKTKCNITFVAPVGRPN